MDYMRMNTIQPLQLKYEPKDDITTIELSKIMILLFGNVGVYPDDPKLKESYMRHFVITDPNK
jgi:hypothetical protein